MRGHQRRRPEPRPARAGARVEGRELTARLATVLTLGLTLGLALGALALAACGRGRAASPAPAESCRPIALHGRRLIEREPPGDRDGATRLVAGIIDLCQDGALAEGARGCVLAATSIGGVRGCPALTAVVGDATGDGTAPSCPIAVDHAMRLLEASRGRRARHGELVDARAAYLDACATLTPAGRACVVAAEDRAAVDECYADPALAVPGPR